MLDVLVDLPVSCADIVESFVYLSHLKHNEHRAHYHLVQMPIRHLISIQTHHVLHRFEHIFVYLVVCYFQLDH